MFGLVCLIQWVTRTTITQNREGWVGNGWMVLIILILEKSAMNGLDGPLMNQGLMRHGPGFTMGSGRELDKITASTTMQFAKKVGLACFFFCFFFS